ncbi:Tra5 Transposase and inactivated derivatives [Burkholderiaceae bacterium]
MGTLSKLRRLVLRDKVSIRQASRQLGISRNTATRWLQEPEMVEPIYPTRQPPPGVLDAFKEQLSTWLKADSYRNKRERRGVKALYEALQAMGYSGSSTTVYRLYRDANLAVRLRKKAKRPLNERAPLQLAQTVNEVWSMDFVSDSLSNGRRIKCLTVADDFSHECVDIAVDYGISGQYVTRLLDQAAIFRGYPLAVRTDNGPEFTSRAFMAWATAHGVRHILIQPGRPMQNGYIESFNGKFRDECLNEQWFQTLPQARTCIAEWRRDYNEVRPHSSLGRIPPAQFAQQHRINSNAAANTNHQVLE